MPDPHGGGPAPAGLSAAGLRQKLAHQANAPRLWVAYSGGLDSRVLLQLCVELRSFPPCPDLVAVHVHHGLQASADDFAEHCRRTSAEVDVPFRLLHVNAGPALGESPEAAARTARYRALAAQLGPGDILLTAQHRDDQAETLLLQLLRGCGLAGLAAMPAQAPLGQGFLLRPLLDISRWQLRDYAAAHRLTWIEDPTNADPRYDRNYLRNSVVPMLVERWPAALETLSRTASHCAEAQRLLDHRSDELLEHLLDPVYGTLCASGLARLSEAERRLVLRRWLRQRGFRSPSAAVVERVLREALPAPAHRQPVVRWSEGEIRRFRDALYLLPCLPPPPSGSVVFWPEPRDLPLPNANGRLVCHRRAGLGLTPDLWESDAVTIRYRRGGERLRVVGRAGTHELKKLLQEAAVPPWLRDRLPLVYVGETVAAVPGLFISEGYAAARDKAGLDVEWCPPAGLTVGWQVATQRSGEMDAW